MPWSFLLTVTALAFAAFQLYTAYFGTFAPLIQRPLHLAFGMLLGFLLYAASPRLVDRVGLWLAFDVAVGFVAAFACWHLVASFGDLMARFGAANPIDLVLGSILFVAVFELGRRTIGPTIPILALIVSLYVLFGPYMPAGIAHRGFSWRELVEFNYLATDGLFGLPIGVSAEFVYVYLLYGALLTVTGAGDFFIKLALRMAGRSVGGPAKVAVVGSALFGTISGSVVANVLATGNFTIPLMKRTGYPREFAAAVEATASTGGQIMPPIMGAAAFIMAEFLAKSYFDVVVYATIPASLFFLSVYISVHLRARKLGLKPSDEVPSDPILPFLLKGWPYFASIAILLYCLMGERLSAEKSAFYAIVGLLAFDVFVAGPRQAVANAMQAIVGSARIAPPVIAAVALAGIIVGGLIASGLSAKITSVILSFSGGSLVATLFLVAAVAIILGTGMTTAADYIVTSLLGVPALVALGVRPEAAHLFVLYYACLSAVTPPVALGAYVAAGVAGSAPFRTGLVSSGLAVSGLIIPFMFVYSPALLMQAPWSEIAIAGSTAMLGIMALALAVEGYWRGPLTIWERALCLAGAVALCSPLAYADIGGLMLLFVVVLWQFYWHPRAAAEGTQ